MTAESAPPVVQTHGYLVAPGRLQATFTILAHEDTRELGRVHLVDALNQTVIASAALTRSAAGPVDEVTVSFSVPGEEMRRLSFQVDSNRQAEWALANISMPVDYGFEVLDLTELLNTFNTHTSSFDAHPNERAHLVMADAVYAALAGPTDGRSSPWRRIDADALPIPSIPAQARTITKASAGRR
jgi:hypothetical protein